MATENLSNITGQDDSSNDDVEFQELPTDEICYFSCTACLGLLQFIRNIGTQSNIDMRSLGKMEFDLLHYAFKRYGPQFTALHAACLLGNFELVKRLVEQGADVNVQTEKLYSPLHILLMKPSRVSSTKEYYIKILDFLLNHGADLELRNEMSETSLHIAIRESNVLAVKCILKYPCNVNVLANSTTPLMNAAVKGSLELVTLLLDNGADPNIINVSLSMLAIHYSLLSRNVQIFKCLLEKTYFDLYNNPDYLSSMLHLIMGLLSMDCLDILINSNCSKDFPLQEISSTLYFGQFCSSYNRICFIGYLLKEQEFLPPGNWDRILVNMLKNGLPIKSVSEDCIPPLSVVTLLCSTLSKPERYISTLIQYGADVNYPNASEPESLLNSCRYGNAKVMLLLLQNSEFATPDSVISGYIRIDDVRNINPEVISLFYRVGMTSSAVRLLSMGRTEGIPTGYVSTLQQLCRLTLRHFFYSTSSNLRIDDILKKCNLPLTVREYIRYRTEKPV